MKLEILIPAAAASAALMFGAANAATITGGTTSVNLNLADDVDVEVSMTGGSMSEDGRFVFDITGGDVDTGPLAGQILHQGSSMTLSAEDGGAVQIVDLVVDFSRSVVSGMVNTISIDGSAGTAEAMDLFTFNLDVDLESIIDLATLNTDLMFDENGPFGALVFGVFGVIIFGQPAGDMTTSPVNGDMEVIPLPGAAVLFGTAIAGVAARRKLVRA